MQFAVLPAPPQWRLPPAAAAVLPSIFRPEVHSLCLQCCPATALATKARMRRQDGGGWSQRWNSRAVHFPSHQVRNSNEKTHMHIGPYFGSDMRNLKYSICLIISTLKLITNCDPGSNQAFLRRCSSRPPANGPMLTNVDL